MALTDEDKADIAAMIEARHTAAVEAVEHAEAAADAAERAHDADTPAAAQAAAVEAVEHAADAADAAEIAGTPEAEAAAMAAVEMAGVAVDEAVAPDQSDPEPEPDPEPEIEAEAEAVEVPEAVEITEPTTAEVVGEVHEDRPPAEDTPPIKEHWYFKDRGRKAKKK